MQFSICLFCGIFLDSGIQGCIIMRWEPFEINHRCSVATCVEFLEVFFFLRLKSITRKVYNPSMENPMGRFCQSMQGCWVWGLVSWLVGGDATPVKRTTTMLPEGAVPRVERWKWGGACHSPQQMMMKC